MTFMNHNVIMCKKIDTYLLNSTVEGFHTISGHNNSDKNIGII